MFLEERKHQRNDSAIPVYLLLNGQEIPQKAFVLNFGKHGFLIKTFEGLALQSVVLFQVITPIDRHGAHKATLRVKAEVIWCHHLFTPQEDYFFCGARCFDPFGVNLFSAHARKRLEWR